jgi:hypothetical protein
MGELSTPPPNPAISELAAVLGDEATREIVRIFLQDFPGAVRRLGSCPREEQIMIAHGLKSSSLHMGSAGLSVRMAAIEARLERPGETLGAPEIDGAIAEFDALAPMLRAYAN